MSHAIISPCGKYRYALTRGEGPKKCVFVLLNPSTADAYVDDPTSRKLSGFATRWGFAGYTLFNVGAGRATDPRAWRAMADPIGPENHSYLTIASYAELVVVGWGNHAPPHMAVMTATSLAAHGATLMCLGENANGSPKHPLYVPYETKLRPWHLDKTVKF